MTRGRRSTERRAAVLGLVVTRPKHFKGNCQWGCVWGKEKEIMSATTRAPAKAFSSASSCLPSKGCLREECFEVTPLSNRRQYNLPGLLSGCHVQRLGTPPPLTPSTRRKQSAKNAARAAQGEKQNETITSTELFIRHS